MKNSGFKDKVLEVVGKIPKGEVLTYGQVAKMAGAYGAGRAVGNILSKNQNKKIPCHRVIKSDLTVGQYNGLLTKTTGPQAKINLLKKEGIKFHKNKIVL